MRRGPERQVTAGAQQLPSSAVAQGGIEPVPRGRSEDEVKPIATGRAPGLKIRLQDFHVSKAGKVAPTNRSEVCTELDADDPKTAPRQRNSRLPAIGWVDCQICSRPAQSAVTAALAGRTSSRLMDLASAAGRPGESGELVRRPFRFDQIACKESASTLVCAGSLMRAEGVFARRARGARGTVEGPDPLGPARVWFGSAGATLVVEVPGPEVGGEGDPDAPGDGGDGVPADRGAGEQPA